MENKKAAPATQQPFAHQHLMAHHVHPNGMYSQHHPQLSAHLTSTQTDQIPPNGVMHQLLQSQYHSNLDARSPLLENRHEQYGSAYCQNQDYGRQYGVNDNYNNYQQSPPRPERSEVYLDHNVNSSLNQNISAGYNVEVYQDYLKRNPPKDSNQIYQNHQPTYRPNANQYSSKPYLPYSNRIGPQSNTELLRKQYNEIQQMKLQQQIHYQNQAQMHQQQKFAERQLLLQQIHGVQPPPNLQNSIYSDSSYRDLDRYSSKNDYKDYSSPETPKDIEKYEKNNDYREVENRNRQYQEPQWQHNQQTEYREQHEVHKRLAEGDKGINKPSNSAGQNQKNNVVSPMKSTSESSSPSVKSPSSESRRSSSGTQALRSPTAQRIPSAPVTVAGILYKQGSDGLKVWRKRWFVLSEYCLFYYKSQEEEKLLGSVLLPSYKVSVCTAEDKVLRKFAFKLEHANMRTYVLAAPDQEAMMKWMKALTMAAVMQTPNDPPHSRNDLSTTKAEDGEDIPMYANAPPKPRRSNEGFNSPSPDMYDPNYDLLKKPASHYSQSINHIRNQEHNYSSTTQDQIYTQSPQSPSQQQRTHHQKRPYDSHNLSLPLTNIAMDRLENEPSTSTNDFNSRSFDRSRGLQDQSQEQRNKNEQIYERQPQKNPFLHGPTPKTGSSYNIDMNAQNQNYQTRGSDIPQSVNRDDHSGANLTPNPVESARDLYGELDSRVSRSNSAANERLLMERRTPDAYGRSTTMSSYNKEKTGDYEDIYGIYGVENDYGKMTTKSSSINETKDNASSHQHQLQHNVQEKTFSGPSVLRKKKMQSSGIQPPMPRPHSADFLEYEAKNEMKNKSMPTRTVHDQTRQPQRPKSSLDINSYYDPSSETYYSEESYAEKMRQSVQYLQQGMRARNMEIPLAKYASGLAQKQLSTAYSQITNHNYNPDLNTANRLSRDQVSHSSKSDVEAMNSNWTLKEKNAENQKDYMNRSGSVMSDGSNASAMVKDASRYDPNGESFLRSASARLPSATEKEGDKKVQQREESMKRLLEWKQRMLQSPLTRKSTPATISLARSLNQSRQSLRSDQYKPKTFSNASYNSYSSDDEEGTPGTDLQNPSEVQAGRSHKVNVTSPNAMQSIVLHAPCDTHHESYSGDGQNITNYGDSPENIYENILCTISLPNIKLDEENDYEETDHLQNNENDVSSLDEKENGYETHESEAESETQEEYTDNDLDEVLLESECEASKAIAIEGDISNDTKDENAHRSITPVCFGESHYLPMSPRKMSIVELPQTTFPCLSELRVSNPHNNEDNPYVEMNIGSENEDTQTYEVLCVNNEKIMEPVYMELTNVRDYDAKENSPVSLKLSSDVASNFADTKEQTLKRASKMAKKTGETDGSDAEIETLTDTSLETPFNRFSISDTFRPASYYLSGSNSVLDVQDVTENEQNYPPLPSSSPPCDELSDDALSKYILEKLDQSNMSNDNSILKMLTTEKQKMSTLKRKTTSLMIYGSPTSIHDTLSRGEKVRHNRATLLSERNKVTSSQASLLKDTDYCYQSSSIDTDSLRSFNAEKGSSRLSLESDISSKFEVIPSSASSEVNSLNESDLAIDFRNPHKCNDVEMMNKRRPLSDDSLFELVENEFPVSNQTNVNVDLDKYLDNLQPCTSTNRKYTGNAQATVPTNDVSFIKDNAVQAAFQSNIHTRCSSTPVRNIGGQIPSSSRSQSPCSSTSITKAPISYYSKQYNEEEDLAKNLNHDETLNKIKEFENEKSVLRSNHDRNASSSSTGFHSRESSTEQSAPYYYSDLSSQEHVNILPTSHYLKNTNLHRKLNNQRRRGPLLKKTEISHIHNPIRKNQVMISDQSFDLVASARSVSVEFLSAADKDPEIDVKNIYESTARKHSKISESMSLISTLGCKSNLSNAESIANKSTAAVDPSSLIKLSSTSMSSHCSENSSNTVYYDAEADNIPYENVLCHGEKHWDEDSVWRDNLRRVSHRHARSMDDLDTVQPDANTTQRNSLDSYVTNSLKRIQKNTPKITRHVTYVNYTFHARTATGGPKILTNQKQQKLNDNDVYVSLAENAELPEEDLDEGVYEQLAIENRATAVEQNKKRFEIDREKLRQWDLMSSGLMKRVAGRVRNIDARLDTGEVARNSDTGTDNAGREASMTMSSNLEQRMNNSSNNQQALSKKAFVGSNTSIGRNNRDTNIPVRAVSPRVRWVEDKPPADTYGSQQMSTSQQNLYALATEDSWAMTRSPSRASQQPISAVSPRVRRNNENNEMQRGVQQHGQIDQFGEIPTAGELLGRTHEELVLLLIQLRRRHAATHRAIEQCCAQISSIEECLSSLKAAERDESLKRLEQLKMQLMELEHQYEKSKPLVQLVDNMVKLGSLYNRPGSTIERLERNQRLRQKVLAEHALEQQRWLESVAAGKPLETEAARARVAELWSLEQELAHEADILQGFKSNKDTIENLLSGVRDNVQTHKANNVYEGNAGPGRSKAVPGEDLEAELARVHAMLAHNSKKLEQTVADNARLERELHQLRRALQARRASAPAHPTAMLEDEVTRVQQLVSALQRQRQELSRAVRHLTQQSQALQSTQDSNPGKNRSMSSWQETNLDTGHTIDHGHSDYEYESPLLPPGYYDPNHVVTPLYVDTGVPTLDVTSPQNDDMHGGFANLSNVEKQEIKTVRIVKRESERRQRDRERSLQPMSDWPNNVTANIEQLLEEELAQPTNYSRAASVPRTEYKYDNYYTRPQPAPHVRSNDKNPDLSPKYVSSPSLSNYDYSRDISSLSSSYNKSYDRSGYDRTISLSTQYLNSPTDSSRTLTNDPLSKTSSIVSLTRSNMELSPIFKSEAAKQIITEMSSDAPKNGSLHRRQVPKEKRRHNTAPHHLSAKTLYEIPKDTPNQDTMARSVDDADMERALRGAAPDVVRSALPPRDLRRADNTIDQLLAAPQKIVIPERYIPEKPPELSPEEQQKRQEKVESIKKMLTSTSADQSKSPQPEEKRRREHLLQMNQILAKQVTEMSKIIAGNNSEQGPSASNN